MFAEHQSTAGTALGLGNATAVPTLREPRGRKTVKCANTRGTRELQGWSVGCAAELSSGPDLGLNAKGDEELTGLKGQHSVRKTERRLFQQTPRRPYKPWQLCDVHAMVGAYHLNNKYQSTENAMFLL